MKNDNQCPYCKEELWSIATYEHHIKTEHSSVIRGHAHKYVIPVEWEYFILWNGEWRHPTAIQTTGTIPPAIKKVTQLMCACGAEMERK